MLKLDKLQTLTGQPVTEIGAILARPLDPAAYKAVPGGADLTDIGTAWMMEKLHEVFGPSGLGWKLTYDPNDLDWFGTETKRPWAILKTAQFQYLVVDAESGEQTWVAVQCNGGSQNEPRYAIKGAITSAIGTAISRLLWQLPVYKGILNHHNAGKKLGGNGNGGKPAAKPAQATTEKPAATALARPSGSGNGNGSGSKPAAVGAAKPAVTVATAAPARPGGNGNGSKPAAVSAKPAAPATKPVAAAAPVKPNGNGNGSKPAVTAAPVTMPAIEQAPAQPAGNGNPAEFVISFGPKAGCKLGEIDAALVQFYATKLVATNDQTKALKSAAQALVAQAATA